MNLNEDKIDFDQVPVLALGQKGRMILSRLLNPLKVLPSDTGLPRDWRGIAHLAGLQGSYWPSVNANVDAMDKVLILWCQDGDYQSASFGNLVKFLGTIDRWDVVDDVAKEMAHDAKACMSGKRRKQQLVLCQNPVADTDNAATNFSPMNELNFLTRGDVLRAQEGLSLQKYDAFVLFADEDEKYASELVKYLEMDHPNYGFKLCVKNRDLIGGIQFEYEACMRLIRERCSRLIAIVTRSFVSSPEMKFFVNYTQALQIELNCRKIVPCFYDKKEECELPDSLRYFSFLSYQQPGKLCNFWERLSDAIRPVNGKAIGNSAHTRIQITEIEDTPRAAGVEEPPITTVNQTKTAKVSTSKAKPEKLRSKSKTKIHSALPVTILFRKKPRAHTPNSSDLTSANCNNINRSKTNHSTSSNALTKIYKGIFQNNMKKK